MQGHRDPGVAQQWLLTVSLAGKYDMMLYIYIAIALSNYCTNPAPPAIESIDITQDGQLPRSRCNCA